MIEIVAESSIPLKDWHLVLMGECLPGSVPRRQFSVNRFLEALMAQVDRNTAKLFANIDQRIKALCISFLIRRKGSGGHIVFPAPGGMTGIAYY